MASFNLDLKIVFLLYLSLNKSSVDNSPVNSVGTLSMFPNSSKSSGFSAIILSTFIVGSVPSPSFLGVFCILLPVILAKKVLPFGLFRIANPAFVRPLKATPPASKIGAKGPPITLLNIIASAPADKVSNPPIATSVPPSNF